MGFEPTRPHDQWLSRTSLKHVLQEFMEYLEIDLSLSKWCVSRYYHTARKFLEFIEYDPLKLDRRHVREFLRLYANHSNGRKANILKALRHLFRFIGREEVMKTFKQPPVDVRVIRPPSRGELKRFYDALESLEARTLFLILASSGLRFSEAYNLHVRDIDLVTGMVTPNHRSRTKKSYITFVNKEALDLLRQLIHEKGLRKEDRIFKNEKKLREEWRRAKRKTGIDINPHHLRVWFANEMARLGIQDRFIDAFQGRIPKTILAKHYSDYSPSNLRKIYEKAHLKIIE